MLTPKQIELRKQGIGSSEIAAVCGIDKYRTPLDVYLEKLGLVESFQGNNFTYWGTKLEKPIAEHYAETNLVELIEVGTLVHPECSFILATPDRIVHEDGVWKKCLEVKTANAWSKKSWGVGSDEIPENYFAQCQWEMLVTGLNECDLAVLIGGNDYREYQIKRDDELLGILVEKATVFWNEHVMKGIPPNE